LAPIGKHLQAQPFLEAAARSLHSAFLRVTTPAGSHLLLELIPRLPAALLIRFLRPQPPPISPPLLHSTASSANHLASAIPSVYRRQVALFAG